MAIFSILSLSLSVLIIDVLFSFVFYMTETFIIINTEIVASGVLLLTNNRILFHGAIGNTIIDGSNQRYLYCMVT